MKYISIFILLVLLMSSCGFTRWEPSPRSIASISPTPGWIIDHKCGAPNKKNCLRLYDYLYWNDVEIRVDALNDTAAGWPYEYRLCLRIVFKTSSRENFAFNPSLSYLILENGKKISSTGFIAAPESDEDRFKNLDYTKPIKFGNYKNRDKSNSDPFILVFDYPPPKVSEEFTIQINGFYKDNEEIKIPLIHFAPGVDKIN